MAREIAKGKQLLADLVEALANDPIRGFSNKDLATALNVQPSSITRAMAELAEIGWAEKDPQTGRFRVTARLSRISARVAVAFAQAEQALKTLQDNHLRNY